MFLKMQNQIKKGFCFSLVIIFTLTVAMSRMSSRIKQLAQEVASLKKD